MHYESVNDPIMQKIKEQENQKAEKEAIDLIMRMTCNMIIEEAEKKKKDETDECT